METKSRSITNMTSGVAAVTAFVTQPVPLLDEVVVIPMHYYLVLRLARERKVSVFALPWKNIQRVIWYGAGARLVGNLSLGLIPVAGALANSVTAVALTEYLGRYLDAALGQPGAAAKPITFSALKDLFNRAISQVLDATKGAAAAPAAAPARAAPVSNGT